MADDGNKIFAIGEEGLRNVIQRSGGGEGGGDVNERVTRLETHFAYIRRDLDSINDKLKSLPNLATKNDLRAWAGIYLLIAFSIIAGVIGGLGWLKPEREPLPPISVTTPPPAIIPVPLSAPEQQATPQRGSAK